MQAVRLTDCPELGWPVKPALQELLNPSEKSGTNRVRSSRRFLYRERSQAIA